MGSSMTNLSNELMVVENVSVSVEDKQIITGLNLKVGCGETHVIMGKNGSGKSSLLNALVKNPKYSIVDGDVRVNGNTILDKSVAEVHRWGCF